MFFLEWLKPGIRIKRWILMGFLGIAVFTLGISKVLQRKPGFDGTSILYIYITFLGIAIIYIALRYGVTSILSLMVNAKYGSKQSIKDYFNEQRSISRGPRVVAIGGGTGLSTMLRGIKEYTSNITAIVTVADDGGGSGMLRQSLGMLPPGDIRNCLVALAHTEPLMEELMQYRFTEGDLKGQNFGNLFIAAMNGISVNFEDAIKKMSDVLAVKGKVLPVTLENVMLNAVLSDGCIVKGESKIPEECLKNDLKIENIFLEPSHPKALDEAIYAIKEADCIIIGPGSLYTSIIPNLLIDEVAKELKNSPAMKVYVSNIMTQPGETTGFKLSDHLNCIEKTCGKGIINVVVANNGFVPDAPFSKYKSDGQEIVSIDMENISKNIMVVDDDLVDLTKGFVRHNTNKLAKVIMELILKYTLPKNRKRLLDYYYLAERIKLKGKEE